MPSTTDLINGLSPSASAGNFTVEESGGLPALTDGSFGVIDRGATTAARNIRFAVGGSGAGTSVTYTLPTPSNITSIEGIGGWQDNGRDQQAYSLEYSTAAAPATFIPIGSVNFNPTGTAGNPVAVRVRFTDDAGNLASNVSNFRVNFTQGVENTYTGYAEFDVFGTPVPEPTALGLLAAGAVGLLARRRRPE